jgi:hypothetical protein
MKFEACNNGSNIKFLVLSSNKLSFNGSWRFGKICTFSVVNLLLVLLLPLLLLLVLLLVLFIIIIDSFSLYCLF